MIFNKYLLSGIIIVSLTGCQMIVDDMNKLSGKSALSQPPSKVEIESAISLKSPIAISAIHAERNYADGISVSMTYKNIDESRSVKYATFKVVFINRVNDVVKGEIKGKEYALLKSTGPFKPNEVSWGGFNEWTNVFYHANADKVEVVSIDVEFMNGEKIENLNVQNIKSGLGYISSKY